VDVIGGRHRPEAGLVGNSLEALGPVDRALARICLNSSCGGPSSQVNRGTPQPNVPGRGIVASYGVRFWMLVVLIGLGAGLGGGA
jgi:hypothetical protein